MGFSDYLETQTNFLGAPFEQSVLPVGAEPAVYRDMPCSHRSRSFQTRLALQRRGSEGSL